MVRLAAARGLPGGRLAPGRQPWLPRRCRRGALRRLAAVALLSATSALPAPAQETSAGGEQEAEPLWRTKVGASVLATTGNAETESLGLDLETARLPTPWGFELQALLHRAEQDGVKTAERYYLGARARRDLGERWQLFVGASGEQDEFAGIDLRVILESGGIYKALRGARHGLDIDVGLTWTDEDQVPPALDSEYFGGLAGLAYTWTISDTSALAQRLVYHANLESSGDWRLDSLTSLSAALTDRLAVQVSYEVRYRNEPIGDNEDTDTTAKVSLVWNV